MATNCSVSADLVYSKAQTQLSAIESQRQKFLFVKRIYLDLTNGENSVSSGLTIRDKAFSDVAPVELLMLMLLLLLLLLKVLFRLLML